MVLTDTKKGGGGGGLGGGGAAVAYNKVYDFMRSSKSNRGRTGRRKEGKEVE